MTSRLPTASQRELREVAEACAWAAAVALFAIGFNAVRPASLPLVAHAPYQTLVPCPDVQAEVEAVPAARALAEPHAAFWVDARDAAAFATARFGSAVNLPYDYLDPTPPEALVQLGKTILASGKNRVWVYGDGATPDSGEQLAKEIAASGIRNVGYLVGGAKALLAGSGGAQ